MASGAPPSLRRPRAPLIVLALALTCPAGSAAQLRPLDAPPWELLESGGTVAASVGVGVLQRQRAALAGTEGRLLELGNFRALWRSGRIAVEASGTAYRVFDDQSRFAAPSEDVEARSSDRRTDAGDYRVTTTLLLTPPGTPAQAVLRFGTRLPTTNDRVGLERDQTDFFAMAGGRLRRGNLGIAGEAGVGIFGTRNRRHEQSDALVYSLAAEYALGAVVPTVTLLGHADPFDTWTPRGNEDLGELRAGFRAGRRLWLQAEWVAGLAEFSPRSGLLLAVGAAR